MLCAEGHHQSPIDLTGAKQEKLEQMKLNILLANLRVVHKKDVREILDNGHTIQINHDMGGT
jgi:carbonic anhydrase